MKYAINTGRATQVSFVNTIANICAKVPDCDMDDVREGLAEVAKMDKRYLGAGLGFGGSCLGKDSRALVSFARAKGADVSMVTTALGVNSHQPGQAIKMAENLLGPLKGRRVSVLGLSFKANTDDIRESVSIDLVEALLEQGAIVAVYDPLAMGNSRTVLKDRVRYAKSALDCISDSECCMVATGWAEFKAISPRVFKSKMANPAIVDGRRILNQKAFRDEGVSMLTIGTGPHT
jgi:UDPglucose 6-dehydrogenase